MPTFLADILAQIKAIWTRLDGGQRLTIGAVLLATMVGIGAIVWFAQQPSMRTVLRADDNQQFTEAVKALTSAGIGYETKGLEVRVDVGSVDRAMQVLRMGDVVGGSNEPGGVMGNLLNTSEDRQVAELLRRQRQAAEAVQRMAGVRRAVVNASRPKKSAFVALDAVNQPKATVLIRLGPDTSFRSVARGAVEIVSATIPVPPEQVTVINEVTKEQFTSNPNQAGLDSAGFRAQERELEDVYRSKALRLLGPLQDKVRLTVTVVLDPQFTSTERPYIPEVPVVLQERSTKEDRKEAPDRASGDPSANAAAGGNVSKGEPAGSKKTMTEKTYQQNLGRVREGLQAPKMKMISFALAVDPSVQKDGKVPAIIDTVKNALAFGDATRIELAPKEKDVLVTDFPKVEDVAPVENAPGTMSTLLGYLPVVGQIVGVLFVLLFLKGLLKRSAPRSLETGSRPAAAPGEAKVDNRLDLDAAESMAPDESARRMRQEIEAAIEQDPSLISRMLEQWLAEQRA